MTLRRIIIFLLLGVVASCVDPLDFNIDKEVNILIVEGSVTTQPGPHKIRLTRSAKYGSIFDGFVRPVKSAEVTIRDSDGRNHELTEDEQTEGIYYTSADFMAVRGKSYTLLIRTPEGDDFTSLPEQVIAGTAIGELSAQYKSTPIDKKTNNTGLAVYEKFDDEPGVKNFYLWKHSGTYKIETFPENYLARDPNSVPPAVPAPKPCCRVCWIDERNDNLLLKLFNDNNVDGNTVTEEVAFIEDDGLRYSDKYLIRVERHTLTPEAYQFFELLNEQASISGDIFDPPPATLRGNMINLTRPDENVIGYFRASDISIDSLFLTRDMLLEPQPPIKINDDCREYRNGYTEEPSYW